MDYRYFMPAKFCENIITKQNSIEFSHRRNYRIACFYFASFLAIPYQSSVDRRTGFCFCLFFFVVIVSAPMSRCRLEILINWNKKNYVMPKPLVNTNAYSTVNERGEIDNVCKIFAFFKTISTFYLSWKNPAISGKQRTTESSLMTRLPMNEIDAG